MTIIYFILIMSVIIIIHELGHLITAKYFNVYCQEFSVGMGPVIFQRKFKETAWSIRALPVGGFVSMAGEEGVEDEDIPFERTMKGIAWWKQVIIMAAGAIMNILLAWLLFVGVTMVQGKVSIPAEPIIVSFSADSPAKEAGFQIDDRIVNMSVGGETITVETYDDLAMQLSYYPDQEVTFDVLRGSEMLSISLMPTYNEEEQRPLIGVDRPANTIKEIGFGESIKYGTEKMIDGSTTIVKSIGKLIRGVGLQNLSGPVGIYQITEQVTQSGLLPALSLIALLSLNIGIFNLLPLPVLDGGRILITFIEKISGRKLSERMEGAIMIAGVVLLVGLMIFATFQDILRIF